MSLFSTSGKRTAGLPTLCVTPTDKQAIAWLVERLSEEHGTSHGVSDEVLIALSKLYEIGQTKLHPSIKQ